MRPRSESRALMPRAITGLAARLPPSCWRPLHFRVLKMQYHPRSIMIEKGCTGTKTDSVFLGQYLPFIKLRSARFNAYYLLLNCYLRCANIGRRFVCVPRGIVRYRVPLTNVLSPRRRNGKGKLIRLGSRFGRRNDSSVEIIWRACRHNVDS